MPPALVMPTPLPPSAADEVIASAPAVDHQVLKLLAAKYQLLQAALHIVETELALQPADAPIVVIPEANADAAARAFLTNPFFSGAAGMLAFSARIEQRAVETPPMLTSIVEQTIANVEARLAAGQATAGHVATLQHARAELDDLAAGLDDATYEALANRITAAEQRLKELLG